MDIYGCVSGCVGMGPSVLLCPGAYNVAKMALVMGNRFKIIIDNR